MSHMSNIKREARVTVPSAGETYTAEDGTISEVIEDSINENYEPSEQEIEEFARWMGMSLPEDAHLLWIAKEGLKTPLPKEWKPCRTDKGEIYYFNFKTGESSWEHPMNELFRTKFKQEKSRQTNEQQKHKQKTTNGSIGEITPNTHNSNASTKQMPLHTTNSINNEQITNSAFANNRNIINNNKNYAQLSSWFSPRAEMSNISSSPNVSSVIADSSLSSEKIGKNAMHHTFNSDTETTLYDQSDSTSLSLLAAGKNSIAPSNSLNLFGTIPHHVTNTLSNNNYLPAPVSPVFTSPFTTPIASTKGLLLSTPTSNNANNALNNETHTTSTTRIVSEAEKALETRIRKETEGAVDAFRQKTKEAKESRLSELQAWYDEEVAKMQMEFRQHESELQSTLERATMEHKNHIEEQMRSKYNEEIAHLTEQLETLEEEKKEHALIKEQQQKQWQRQNNNFISEKEHMLNQESNKELEKYEVEEAKADMEKEIENSKEHAEHEMQAQQSKILQKLTDEFTTQKEEIQKAFHNTCELLEKEYADSIHAREVNIATATEKRRKELNDAIHNIEEQISTLAHAEKETLATDATQIQSLPLSNNANVHGNSTASEKLEKHTAEAIHSKHTKFDDDDDEKRKLCGAKENEIKILQEQLEKLQKEEQECTNVNSADKEDYLASIHDQINSNTMKSITIDELKAKHTSELKRVEEMFKELRNKLEKSLQEELNTLKIKSNNNNEQSSALESKAKAIASNENTAHDNNANVNEKELIESALEADMQVYVSEVQQRRARAKELYDVQGAKLTAAHEVQEIKHERERVELTKTIVEERVEEELERERTAAVRAHAEAMARLHTQCAEEKKIIMSAIDEEINAFAQSKRKEREEHKKEEQRKQLNTVSNAMNMHNDKLSVAHNGVTVDEEQMQHKLNELQSEKQRREERQYNELMVLTEKLQSMQNKIRSLQDDVQKHKNIRELRKCMSQKELKDDVTKMVCQEDNSELHRHISWKQQEQEQELEQEQEQMQNLINDYKIKEMELKEQLMQWRNVNATISEEIRHEIIERELNNLALENENRNNEYECKSDNNSVSNSLTQTHKIHANTKHNATSVTTTLATRISFTSLALSSSTALSSASSSSLSSWRQTPLTSREAQWYCQAQLDHLSQREIYLQELRKEYECNIQHLNYDKEREQSLTSSHYSSHSMNDSLRHVDEELLTVVDALNKRMNALTHNVRQLHSTHNSSNKNHIDNDDKTISLEHVDKYIGQLDDKWRNHLLHLYGHYECETLKMRLYA